MLIGIAQLEIETAQHKGIVDIEDGGVEHLTISMYDSHQ